MSMVGIRCWEKIKDNSAVLINFEMRNLPLCSGTHSLVQIRMHDPFFHQSGAVTGDVVVAAIRAAIKAIVIGVPGCICRRFFADGALSLS
ncbi:hypothetical protein DRY71_22520 [Salmonella enterica subsp. enterica serovar Newport]|uniref:Uncharacterized protein n=1 Tax=Salmonella newport TaxID=108619 RepID=A0A5U9KW63_SALNE|nr:hypothetical protein [Salmonella enterica subsp. enterica serovar Newport]